MTGTFPLAHRLALASVTTAVVVVILSAVATAELAPVFGIVGLVIVIAAGVGLWTGHPTTVAAASTALAAMVTLAARSADADAIPFAGLVLLAWTAAVLAHLSIVWRVQHVASSVVHRTALQLCAIGLLGAVIGAGVIHWSGAAAERDVTTEAIGVAAIVAVVVLAAAFAPRRERPRAPA